MKTALSRLLLAAAVAVTASLVAPSASLAGGDWNDKGIDWMSYEAGVKKAKEVNKPVLMVFYTDWCPHCTNYSKIFHDEKVVEKAKKFVMVRMNMDENRELSGQFTDGGKQYVPRTFFLGPDGKLAADLTAGRDDYKYFYHELDPASILAGMDRALAKFGS